VKETSWKLEELAERAGVSARTVRYYVQRGLLPAPEFRGRDTTYNQHHLDRLGAIRKLQERFLPLDAIEGELAKLSPEEIRKLSAGVQDVKAQLPVVAAVPRPATGEARWTRWEIRPGLEIHLSEAADAITRSLAEELRALARKYGGSR
jgi:DNA-binding transcriptional MerR regulator